MTTTRGRPLRASGAVLGLVLAAAVPAAFALQPEPQMMFDTGAPAGSTVAGLTAAAVPMQRMGAGAPGAPMPMHGGPGDLRGGPEPLLPPFIRLTADQEDKVFELRHAQEPALRKQMKELHDAHAQLRLVALTDNYDEGRARQAATRVSTASTELALMRARLQHAAFALLTPEQRKRLEQCKPGADGAPPPAECSGPPR